MKAFKVFGKETCPCAAICAEGLEGRDFALSLHGMTKMTRSLCRAAALPSLSLFRGVP
jgi:hypothetical protein